MIPYEVHGTRGLIAARMERVMHGRFKEEVSLAVNSRKSPAQQLHTRTDTDGQDKHTCKVLGAEVEKYA